MGTDERKNSTEVGNRENRRCLCVMLQSIAACFVACPISQAGISVPANVSISQTDSQTDSQKVIDRVKMKCAEIAQFVFWKYHGPGARILKPQRRKGNFLFSLSLVISFGIFHPSHQRGMRVVSLAVNWPKLEGNQLHYLVQGSVELKFPFVVWFSSGQPILNKWIFDKPIDNTFTAVPVSSVIVCRVVLVNLHVHWLRYYCVNFDFSKTQVNTTRWALYVWG